ncbi:hypothetical protein FALB51S_03350 [Frigidibacter albus]
MIETIAQFELHPAEYPAITGLTGDELATAWQRIEAYTAYRFSPRTVTWLLKSSGGEWVLPLRPASSVTAKIWTGDGYATVTLASAPGGWKVPCGRYEISATVGAGPVPAAVATAVKRLADYLAQESPLPAGLRSYSANVGQLSETVSGDPAMRARALQNSGAADLLRPYRRA